MLGLLAAIPTSRAEQGGSGHNHHRIRVPSSTEGPELTTGFEANLYRKAFYGNLLLEYRPEDSWMLSTYLTNMPIVGSGAQNFAYDAYVGLAKSFAFSDLWQVTLGTQNGTTLFDQPRQWHTMEYAQASLSWGPLTIGAGPYLGSRALTTTAQTVGAMLSVDAIFQPGRLWAEADWFTGNNNLSGGVFNLIWKAQPWLKGYVGIQVPATASGNAFAGNLGVVMDWAAF